MVMQKLQLNDGWRSIKSKRTKILYILVERINLNCLARIFSLFFLDNHGNFNKFMRFRRILPILVEIYLAIRKRLLISDIDEQT